MDEQIRNTLIGIHVTLFDAVPGAERLAWMNAQVESGQSVAQVAQALTTTYAEDFAAVPPPPALEGFFVGYSLAGRLLGLYGKLVPADAWSWAWKWASDMFDAGATYPELVVLAVDALGSTTNPEFAQAKALLENRIAIARHAALDLQLDPVNLMEARDVVALVDHLPGSVNSAREYLAARGDGLALTAGTDDLSSALFNAFPIYGPGASYANTLQTGDVLTGTGISATLNAAISSRDFVPHLVPVLHDIPVVNFWVTGDRMLSMDLQHASGLRKLTLNSEVRVDVHGLRTDGKADGSYLEVDARGMSAEFLLFMTTPLDAGQIDSASHDALRDLVIRTGDGRANILVEGTLAGSIHGGRGGAEVRIGRDGDTRDMLGISSIHNAVGAMSITVADMLATASDKDLSANAGFDDVSAAVISARGGWISVNNLRAAQDWDGPDRFKWIGASIATLGETAARVNFRSMADGTSITMGAGNDSLYVMQLNGATVLAGDSDGDGIGAVIDLGAGEDTANFLDYESRGNTDTLLFDRGAVLRGAERVIVEALDHVRVTTLTSSADTAPNFVGTRFLELEIENQTLAVNGEYHNDDDEHDGSIEVDLLRFDTALEWVRMTSHERVDYFFDGVTHRPGAPTAFILHNVSSAMQVLLDAEDVTTHLLTPTGVMINDALLTIDRQTGVATTNAAARDVSLWLSPRDARGFNDAFSLGFGGADLDLTLAPTSTDTVGAAASSTDDDAMLIEHLTLRGTGSADLNGFGDLAHRAFAPPVLADDISSPVETSLEISVGWGDYTIIDGVNADTITLNGGVSTRANESALVLRVDAPNNYRIKTVSGNDLFDLRADTLRADDAASAVDRADHIDAGAGFDTVIIRGDNNLGSNDLQPTQAATIFEDDVFATLVGVEEILIDTDAGVGTTQMITLDEAAANSGLERLRFVGGDIHTASVVLGKRWWTTTPSGYPRTTHIDASTHEGDFNLVLSNDAQTGISPRFTLHVRAAGAAAVSGDNILIVDGSESQTVELVVTTASQNVDTHVFEGLASAAGDVALTVAKGSIGRITLVDGGAENAAGVETTSDTYVIAKAWTRSPQFNFDASAIADTDNDPTTGGLVISAQLSDARLNYLLGSQNQDLLTGSAYYDVITGGGGNDTIVGGAGDDWITGGAGADRFVYGASAADGRLAVAAGAGSHLPLHDTIFDFTTGVDEFVVHLGSHGHIVNLGRFDDIASAGTLAERPLEGSLGMRGPVVGDAFYTRAEHGLVVDVDGNGAINIVDLFIRSDSPVAATDIAYVVAGADTNDLMRAGLGADTLRGFAGDDSFVMLGAVTAADRLNYEAAGNAANAGITGDIAAVLTYGELLTLRQGSEAARDTYDGGLGTDFLHTFGTVDLSASTLLGIEWVVQHSSVTYKLSQLGLAYDAGTGAFSAITGGISGIALHGALAHGIVIADENGVALDASRQIEAMVAFLDRPGRQLLVPQGGAGTVVSIGGATLTGTDALLGTLANFRDEALDLAALTNTAPFTGAGGLYGMFQAAPVNAAPRFNPAADYQLVDAGAGAVTVAFAGEFTRQSQTSNYIGNFDAGSAGDVFDFREYAWLRGGIERSISGASQAFEGALLPFYSFTTAPVAVNGMFATVRVSGLSTTESGKPTLIARLFSDTGPFRLTQEGDNRVLLLTGEENTATLLWYIDDANDDGTVAASEVHLVGQVSLNSGDDIHTFDAANFLFAA